jgi:hypothetical protein
VWVVEADVFADVVGLRVPQEDVGEPAPVAAGVGSGVRKDPRAAREWVDGWFVKGPLPGEWVGRVFALRKFGTAAVAMAVLFERGLQGRNHDLALRTPALEKFHVTSREMKSRALHDLEGAGLIRVDRRPGQNPRVTLLLDVPDSGGQRPAVA